MVDFKFAVERESLYRQDGVDTMYDALYRDNGEQLHVVGRDYQLVTHEQAVGFLHKTLEDANIAHEPFRWETTSRGKRLMYEVRFPAYRFDIPGDESGVEPTAKLWNSLDKTKGFKLTFGTFRLICSNGLSIGQDVLQIMYTHYRNNIQFQPIGEELVDKLETVIVDVSARYKVLMEETAKGYLKQLITILPPLMMAEVAVDTHENYAYECETRGGVLVPKKFRVINEMKAYALLQVVSAIATHQVKSARRRQVVDQTINKVFGL